MFADLLKNRYILDSAGLIKFSRARSLVRSMKNTKKIDVFLTTLANACTFNCVVDNHDDGNEKV